MRLSDELQFELRRRLEAIATEQPVLRQNRELPRGDVWTLSVIFSVAILVAIYLR